MLGFTPTVTTSGPVDTAVPAGVRDQLLPVLREAVSNVARHAHAEQAQIEVQVSATELCLSVSDDGVGLAERADGERPAQRTPPRGAARRIGGAARRRDQRYHAGVAGAAPGSDHRLTA